MDASFSTSDAHFGTWFDHGRAFCLCARPARVVCTQRDHPRSQSRSDFHTVVIVLARSRVHDEVDVAPDEGVGRGVALALARPRARFEGITYLTTRPYEAGEAGRARAAAERLQALLDDALSRVELVAADDDVPDDALQAAWTAALARCDDSAAG